MNLNEARELLQDTTRFECRDHAFGDREVTWMRGEIEVAGGYFSGSLADVWFEGFSDGLFKDKDARSLLDCGTLVVDRNDSTGSETYQEGVTMPGLTKEAVRREISMSHPVFSPGSLERYIETQALGDS